MDTRRGHVHVKSNVLPFPQPLKGVRRIKERHWRDREISLKIASGIEVFKQEQRNNKFDYKNKREFLLYFVNNMIKMY